MRTRAWVRALVGRTDDGRGRKSWWRAVARSTARRHGAAARSRRLGGAAQGWCAAHMWRWRREGAAAKAGSTGVAAMAGGGAARRKQGGGPAARPPPQSTAPPSPVMAAPLFFPELRPTPSISQPCTAIDRAEAITSSTYLHRTFPAPLLFFSLPEQSSPLAPMACGKQRLRRRGRASGKQRLHGMARQGCARGSLRAQRGSSPRQEELHGELHAASLGAGQPQPPPPPESLALLCSRVAR